MTSIPEGGVDPRDLAKRAVRGSMWAAAGAYSTFVVNFVAVATLARYVGPAGFGSYSLALAYTQVLSALGLFPFGQAVVQSPRDPRIAETAMRMTLAVRGAILLLAIPAALVVRHVNGPTVAWLFLGLGLNELLDGVRGSMAAVLERDLRFRALSSTMLAAAVSASVVAVVAAKAGLGAPALLLRDVLMEALVLLVYAATRRSWGLPAGRSFDRIIARRVWVFARSLFWVRSLEQILARADRVVLGNILGLEPLGYFHQAKYLATLPQSALAPANMQVAVSTYSKVRDDRALLARAFDMVQYVVLRVVPLAGLALALFPEEILRAMYGARWVPAAPALRVLGIYATLSPILESYRGFSVAMEQWRQLRWSVLAQGALLISALAILAPRFGVVGAAWATCLTPVAGLVVLRLTVTRHLLPARHGVLGPVCLAVAAGLLAGLVLQRTMGGTGGVAGLALKLAAPTAAYALVLLLLEGRSLLERASYLRARAAR
jgi:PST family polysaccharide transporter